MLPLNRRGAISGASCWLRAGVAALLLACGSDDEVQVMVGASQPETGSSGGEGNMPGTPTTGYSAQPTAGQYGTRAALLAPNSEMAVAETAGEIYVLGGYPASRDVQTSVQVYTPATDSWRFAAPMPVPTHHPVAIGVDGRIYSLGGQLTGDINTERSFVLDTAADVWSEIAPLPTPRGGGAVARIDNSLYVVGGRPPAGNAFEAYDITTDGWTVLEPLPLAYNQRNHLVAAAIGNKIYVAGGRYDGGFVGSPMTDALDVYDTSTATWSSAAPLPRPRGGLNGVIAFNCFHVWGGEGQGIGEANDVFPDHDVYDPVSDSWTSLAPLPTPVHGVTGAAFLDGVIYMPGGGTASGGNSGSVIHQVFRVDRRCDGEGEVR